MATLEFTVGLLSADEEINLAKQIEAGLSAANRIPDQQFSVDDLATVIRAGQRAWEKMWLANLRLVNKISHTQARRFGISVDDIFQEACVGLAEALIRYDYQRGARFSTFAHYWIKRTATAAAIATARRISPKKAHSYPFARIVSLTEAVAQQLTAPSERQEQPWWLDQLPLAQRNVIIVRHLKHDGATLNKTASILGLSVSQVRRLEASAFAIVRELLARAA